MMQKITHALALPNGDLTIITMGCVLMLWVVSSVFSNPIQHQLAYNNSGLTVDLGEGLWAVPLPIDFDEDGDLDLLVSYGHKPTEGLYFFENNGTTILEAGIKIAPGRLNLTISYTTQGPIICEPGWAYPDFRTSLFSRPVPIPFQPDFYIGRKKPVDSFGL